VAEQIQMVLYAKTANLGHAVPPLQACVAHCCRPDNSVPVDRLNLDFVELRAMCRGGSKDAFPELTGAGAPLASPSPAAAVTTAAVEAAGPSRRLTRRSGGL